MLDQLDATIDLATLACVLVVLSVICAGCVGAWWLCNVGVPWVCRFAVTGGLVTFIAGIREDTHRKVT